jgi:membrane-associated phospholipid phosphatase
MSAQPDPGASGTYLSRLSVVAAASMTQLVRSPSQARPREAARRLARQSLLTAILGGICVLALMIWLDAWEIALMPPRGTASLWPARILTDFGKDTYVLLLLAVMFFALVLVAPAAREPLRGRLLEFAVRLQFLFCAVAVPLTAGELTKWVVGRGRPFVGGKANPFNFTPFAGTEAHASFPSAHSITAFALAFAVAAAWPRARGVMIAYALVIAATRLVLLAHHPSDVVAGAVIGIVGALVVRYWFAARGLGFAMGEHGAIAPVAARHLKGVAAEASAT